MEFIICGIVVLIAIAILAAYLSKAKCPRCRKRTATQLSSRKTGSTRISFKKKDTVTNGSGKVIRTRHYTRPGIRTYYDVTYKCNACGEVFVREETTECEI